MGRILGCGWASPMRSRLRMPLQGDMRCVTVGGIRVSEGISFRLCEDVRRGEQGEQVRFMTGVKVKWRSF